MVSTPEAWEGDMKNTCEFLDAIKAKNSLTSDYQLAKLLGCTPSAIGNYRHGKSMLSDEYALKVADLLGLEGGYVLAASSVSGRPLVYDAQGVLIFRVGPLLPDAALAWVPNAMKFLDQVPADDLDVDEVAVILLQHRSNPLELGEVVRHRLAQMAQW